MTEQDGHKTPYFFAVPVLLMRNLALAAPEGANRRREDAIAEDFDVIVEVFDFAGEQERADAVETLKQSAAAKGTELILVVGKVADAACDVFVASGLTAEMGATGDDLDGEFYVTNHGFLESDLRQLRKFSRFTGLRFFYCYGVGISHAPFPDEPGLIRMFSHGRPPGIFERDMPVKELFGMKTWKDGETRVVNSPTRGRGRIIEDGGTCIFQVLGRNYYQLCLTCSEFHDPVGRDTIFRKMLGCMYADLVEQDERESAPLPETTEEKFAAFGNEQAAKVLRELREKLRVTEDDLRKLEIELAEKLRLRQAQITRLKAMTDSEFVRDLHERLPREIGELRRIEGVAAVRIVDTGVHLETKPVVITHKGHRYDLGPFVVRLDPDGRVEVWSEEPRHPKGHHHPHVDRVTLACYGNATVAIRKYMSAYRFADAARLAMRWLATYSPDTTLTPIEEWPSADTSEPKKETVNGTSPEPVATA